MPSSPILKETIQQQNLRALYVPPAVAEQLLQEPNGVDFFKKLDFLCYTGGPFSPSAGEKLSNEFPSSSKEPKKKTING